MLTQDDQKKIEEIITDVIEEGLMPAMGRSFDTLNEKVDDLRGRVNVLETSVERMDRKLDVITAKVFTHDSELVKHDKNFKRLEKTVHLAAS